MTLIEECRTPAGANQLGECANKRMPCQRGCSIDVSDVKAASISWDELIEKLLEIFDAECVNIEEVEELLSRYNSKEADWNKFAKFDKYKYTRNLVHEGNGKFNLMLLCWAEGNASTIHDHANAHCFVKVLGGGIRETRYFWPHEKLTEEGKMFEKERTNCKVNDVTYMSDELGLHRVENPSHSTKAVSLHLYSPPFKSCQIFDERTGKTSVAPMTFWSRFGEKVQHDRKRRPVVRGMSIDKK